MTPEDASLTAPSAVRIVEVGPRDGLQNEPGTIATSDKIALIERLVDCGLTTIEITSAVRADAVPQLADAAEIVGAVAERWPVAMDPADPDTRPLRFPVLVPNSRGWERVAGSVADIAVFTAASESFSQRNTNTSIAGSLERIREVVTQAAAGGVHVRAYVSCAFGCPFEGEIDPAAVEMLCAQLLDLGIAELSIGDTIGAAIPMEVRLLVERLLPLVDSPTQLGLHLHDTRGMAIANALAGLESGILTFDTSIAGLGGCPFAPGATGNLATEDLAWLLERSGISTGLDLDRLIDTATFAASLVGRPPAAHVSRAPVWKGAPTAPNPR